MRVLFLSHLFPHQQLPGNGQFVYEQAQAISRSCQVQVLSCHEGVSADSIIMSKGLEIIYVPLPRVRCLNSKVSLVLSSLIYLKKSAAAITRLQLSFDLIHAHFGFPDGAVGIALSKITGKPVVLTLHGSDFNRQLKRRTTGSLLARLFSQCSRVICVSKKMKLELDQQFPTSDLDSVFIPNGFNANDIFFIDSKPRENFLFVGRLDPVKNPDVLLKAFARIKNQIQSNLIMIGDGPLKEAMRDLAEALDLKERVSFLGFVEHADLNEWYNRSLALILPSRSEGMPIVALEALATGTPVVASCVGGLPELISDEELGILVEPNDPVLLSHALLEADQRQWNHRWIANESRHMTWETNADLVVSLYKEVLAQRANPSSK